MDNLHSENPDAGKKKEINLRLKDNSQKKNIYIHQRNTSLASSLEAIL